MKLPRWNNARLQRPQGKRVVLRAFHSGQGLEVKKRFSLPVEGEVFSLTFPFIEQAVTLSHNALRNRLHHTGPVCPFPFFRLRMSPFSAIPQRNEAKGEEDSLNGKSELGLKFGKV